MSEPERKPVESSAQASDATYANGKPKFNGFRRDGEMDGSWEWFRLDGSLLRTGAFERGRQVGPWRTYDRSGRLVKETDFGA
jgi:antitoxin component YwqK of YwqJK toxin-antitoxin module